MKMLIASAFALTAAAALTSAPASAQSGWTPYHGCWQPAAGEAPASALVCLLPGAEAQSVRMVTFQNETLVDETVLRADGVARPFEDEGCTGTESASFSRDGRRVFTRADLDCSGTHRVSTGILAFTSEVEWLEVQAMTVGEQSAARSVRYRAVPRSEIPAAAAALMPAEQRLAVEAARLNAAAPLTVGDVTEASAAVAAAAVEALLGARQQGFGLNAAALLELERGGVPGSTIDVVVALSYPSSFIVEEQSSADDVSRSAYYNRYGARDACYDTRWMSHRYEPGCFGSSYGYYGCGYELSPCGYDRWRWNDRTYNRPVVIIVRGTENQGGTVSKDRGYTAGSAPSRGSAQPRTAAPSRDSGSTGATRSTPTTGSSEPPASGSSGRTAKPRTGGGGGEGGY